MNLFFRKTSVVSKRLKKIEKELSSVNNGISFLSKNAKKKNSIFSGRNQEPSEAFDENMEGGHIRRVSNQSKAKDPIKKPEKIIHDDRLADYLSGSFQVMRPLRYERRIQRNKAIVMVLFVMLIMFWLLYKIFFL